VTVQPPDEVDPRTTAYTVADGTIPTDEEPIPFSGSTTSRRNQDHPPGMGRD
jgi:hypothetical protein